MHFFKYRNIIFYCVYLISHVALEYAKTSNVVMHAKRLMQSTKRLNHLVFFPSTGNEWILVENVELINYIA